MGLGHGLMFGRYVCTWAECGIPVVSGVLQGGVTAGGKPDALVVGRFLDTERVLYAKHHTRADCLAMYNSWGRQRYLVGELSTQTVQGSAALLAKSKGIVSLKIDQRTICPNGTYPSQSGWLLCMRNAFWMIVHMSGTCGNPMIWRDGPFLFVCHVSGSRLFTAVNRLCSPNSTSDCSFANISHSVSHLMPHTGLRWKCSGWRPEAFGVHAKQVTAPFGEHALTTLQMHMFVVTMLAYARGEFFCMPRDKLCT